jgi:ABC-type transport system involved in multi-copper enzyme maturation permease subunit
VYGDPVTLSTLGFVTVYASAYVGVCLLLSYVAFRRRDLP